MMERLTTYARRMVLPLSLGITAVAGCNDADIDEEVGEASLAVAPDHVTSTLEGCKLPAGETLPNANGDFICDDADYTTGNLGKSWNELDLVPYRITMHAGNAAPATQTYTIAIAVDHLDSGAPGYDVLSAPVLNTALSDASCTAATAGPETIMSPGLGGIDETLFRTVTITQLENTTCVYDYFARLALGSHLFPGSSLHANLALPTSPTTVTTSGIGASDVSIPVNAIQPQELRKTMAATQDSTHAWNVFKQASPAEIEFADTCNPGNPLTAGVEITVAWEKLPPTPSGQITVITNIFAKNPAHRTITVDVIDEIFDGATLLDTKDCDPVPVPANTELMVCSHTLVVGAATDLHDVATATYVDQDTGIPVPGTTEATASATVTSSGIVLNQTATISDSESISGAHLTFSADSFTPAVGAFAGGYVAGTPTVGPVVWNSNTQSGDGQVVFSKTVYVDSGAITSGTLSDTATLTGSDGFTASDSASVAITTSAQVSLKIEKSIPNILSGAETATFDFEVRNAANVVVATPSITFSAGETNKDVTVSGLAPGSYTVSEAPAAGWQPQPDASATITLPDCSETVSFTNDFGPASAQARKLIVGETGSQAGWELILTGPGTPPGGEHIFTTGAAFDPFATVLEEGLYTITEVLKPGFEQVSESGCSFTVDYPADSDKVFSCTITNKSVPTGKIAPTATTCQDFTSGTAADLNQIDYRTKQGVINNVAPGVFFYYSTIEAPSASFVIDVVQSETHPTFSTLFDPQNASNVRLFNADCTVSALGTISFPSPGQVRITVNGATAGDVFIVSVKYVTGSVVGKAAPNPTTVHYDFQTQVDGGVVDRDVNGLDLKKKGGN